MILIRNRLRSLFLILLVFCLTAAGASAQTAADTGWKQLNSNLAAALTSSQQGVNSSIIDALKDVPRHRFLSEAYISIAYDDISLPGAGGDFLPSPTDCMRTIEMLSPNTSDTVLVAGNNAGYTAAVLSHLAGTVYLIEETSAAEAYKKLFTELGLDNIIVSDSSDINAFDSIIAFDKILIHGAVSEISENITERLSIQGNITFILAEPGGFQQIVTIRRSLLGDSISCAGSCYFPEIKSLRISN